MAPNAANKRPAATAAHAPAKKGRKSDPIKAKCDSIVSAVREVEGLPKPVRDMLAHSLPSCLRLYKADRHDFQHAFVAMGGEALSDMGAHIKKSIAEAEAEVASADTRKAALEAACAAGEKTLEDKKADVSSKKEAFAASTAAKKAAAVALKEAEKEEQAGNRDLDEAAGKKEDLDIFRSTIYKEMMEKTATKTGTTALAKLGKKFSYEGELIKALSGAVAKAPDSRGTFDKVVVTQFEEQMDKTLAALSATLAQGEPAKQERAAKVASAKSSQEASQAADEACSQALADAKNAETEAQKALDSSKKELTAFVPNLAKTCNRLDGLKAKDIEFSDGALAYFKELEAHVAPPPEEEKPTEAPVEGEPAPVVESVSTAA